MYTASEVLRWPDDNVWILDRSNLIPSLVQFDVDFHELDDQQSANRLKIKARRTFVKLPEFFVLFVLVESELFS